MYTFLLFIFLGGIIIMAILVTGGAGYIGSHTTIELLNYGHEVVLLDNFLNSKREVIERIQKITGKKVKVYEADLLNKELLEEVFSQNEINSVIHFAGLKAVGESVSSPLKYYQNNINGTVNLCEVMKKHNVKRLVFSSSATVYGIPKEVPILENFPRRATNPYGRTKLMIEEILDDLYTSDPDWSIAILRYFNPIGAHNSGDIGEDPNGIPNNLMPFITQVAIGKLSELQVFGDDYSTVDGTGVRDYIHVVDLAKGHLAALDKIMETNGVKVYNLGTGRGYSVLEIVKAFENAAGVKIPFKVVERRPGDVASCYAEVTRANKELGWIAEKGIEEMCQDSWRWQKKNPHGFKEILNKKEISY